MLAVAVTTLATDAPRSAMATAVKTTVAAAVPPLPPRLVAAGATVERPAPGRSCGHHRFRHRVIGAGVHYSSIPVWSHTREEYRGMDPRRPAAAAPATSTAAAPCARGPSATDAGVPADTRTPHAPTIEPAEAPRQAKLKQRQKRPQRNTSNRHQPFSVEWPGSLSQKPTTQTHTPQKQHRDRHHTNEYQVNTSERN